MHSSKMRTARSSSRMLGRGGSASVHAGILPPGVGLDILQARPPPNLSPGCGSRPPGQTPQLPPGCGPRHSPRQTPQLPPLGVGLETPPPARPLNFPLCAGLDTPWQTTQLPPLGVGLDTLARPLNFSPGCGPGHPPGQTPQLPPWVWA